MPARSFAFAPMFNGAPDANNPEGHDATGGFQLGMERFRTRHMEAGGTVTTYLFDNHIRDERARRRSILAAMEQAAAGGRLDCIAYFGHGWMTGLSTAGFWTDDVPHLGDTIIRLCNPHSKVLLYACFTAAPGGFAYRLGRHLAAWTNYGMAVIGHPVKGHAFRNAAVRQFPSSRGETGEWVPPVGEYEAWKRAMAHTSLWARFPFMSPEEIREEVRAYALSHPAPPPVHHAARPHAPAGR